MRGRAGRMQRYYANDSQLGKTIVGKILSGAGDVIKGSLNVLVTPFEGIFNTQIIGDNYSDTGFGNFIATSQDKNASLNKVIGTVVSAVFTGGAVKINDVPKNEQKAILELQTSYINTVTAKQQEILTNNALTAAQKEEELKKLAIEERNKKVLIGTVLALGTLGVATYKYKKNRNKK